VIQPGRKASATGRIDRGLWTTHDLAMDRSQGPPPISLHLAAQGCVPVVTSLATPTSWPDAIAFQPQNFLHSLLMVSLLAPLGYAFSLGIKAKNNPHRRLEQRKELIKGQYAQRPYVESPSPGAG